MTSFTNLYAKIRRYPAAEVTTIDRESEEDPRAVGLNSEGVESIWQAVERLYATRCHPAIALCLRRGGRIVINRAIGHERGNAPDDPASAAKPLATPKSLFNLFSALKSITAMLVHLLDDHGLVHLDDPVAEYIPEFGRKGKEWITLRHILTHRAGIPTITNHDVDLDLLVDWNRIIAIICDAKPVWAPGRRLAYHALTGGFVLGEVVRRVTGRDARSFLRQEVLDPLGFEHLCYGVPADEVDRVALNAFTGTPPPWPGTWLLRRALGVGHQEAIEVSNDPRFLTGIVPAGNIIGTAEETCRFYELLLNQGELAGTRIFEPRTVRRAVAEQSYLEVDLTLGLPLRYGMGFILGARTLSLYGHRTARAFGHVGFTNVVSYADPERDISVALMTSGKPLLHGALPWLSIMWRIASVCPRGAPRRVLKPVHQTGRFLRKTVERETRSA